jgi:Co/Zn/Cd efflux system component
MNLSGIASSAIALIVGAALILAGAVPKLQDGQSGIGVAMLVLGILAIGFGVAGMYLSLRRPRPHDLTRRDEQP